MNTMNTRNTTNRMPRIPAPDGGAQHLIQLEHISKVYEPEGQPPFQALEDVSLEIDRGEFVGVIGTSGSGKSTLLRILGCEERPTEGVYRFAGEPLSASSQGELSWLRGHEIAVIPQQYRLDMRRPVWENVAGPLRTQEPREDERRRRAVAALRRVGLGDFADRTPDQLSGGQQQRVAIARALVQRPTMVLADEPTGALDMETKEYVFQLFRRMNQDGMTVVIITHDLSLAARTRRLVRIHQGHICEDRPLENLA